MLVQSENTPTIINVWIIEDDAPYSQTLTYLLNHTSDMQCQHAFERCEEALHLLKRYEGSVRSWTKPDVLLLDINLPGVSGIQGIGRLKALLPRTQIVMLTIRDDAETIYQALRAGASGYLIKDAGVDEIIAAVRQAFRGGVLMPAPVARQVFGFFQERSSTNYGLTEREKEVLYEMSQGYTQKEIAIRLFVTPHTINTHIQHIYAKLHVHSGIEAVAKALREDLI